MKKRIYTLAGELGCSNQALLEVAQSLGFAVSSVSSSLSEAEEAKLLAALSPRKSKSEKPPVKAVYKKAIPQNSRKQRDPKIPAKKRPPASTVKTFTARYEKKPKKKSAPPQVKTISPQKANRLFVFGLFVLTAILMGLGGLGIASDLRMNQLVKDTNQAIQTLNQDNQNQNQAIKQLEQGVKR
ncbi:MAG: translation initiation factor IF-2 N-terminal domain-containing protein [Streptococcaceae bacterium]|jgi:cell division protein FtsB|nr:translation initiation factor IF-2 N-terminal domain-containing protein [Streptococcaceae bacterium]